jgi:hypothetical protein
MKTAPPLLVIFVLGLAGCGGPSHAATVTGLPTNAFTGTLSISSALPASTTTCLATHTVSITAAGASLHNVGAAGGDCLAFVNDDTADHQPATYGSPACPELDAPAALVPGGTFTTAPLSGPKTCHWEDSLNPPSSGGGGGGGGY